MRVHFTLVKYNNDHTRVPCCSEGLKNVFFLEKVNTASHNIENHKDPGWSWTQLGAALVSLESLDMIFDV